MVFVTNMQPCVRKIEMKIPPKYRPANCCATCKHIYHEKGFDINDEFLEYNCKKYEGPTDSNYICDSYEPQEK